MIHTKFSLCVLSRALAMCQYFLMTIFLFQVYILVLNEMKLFLLLLLTVAILIPSEWKRYIISYEQIKLVLLASNYWWSKCNCYEMAGLFIYFSISLNFKKFPDFFRVFSSVTNSCLFVPWTVIEKNNVPKCLYKT